MTPKGANLQATDLLEISELSGTGYITKSITGQQIINAGGGGGSQNLQQVTDIGSETSNMLISASGFAVLNSFIDPNEFSVLQNNFLELTNNITSHQLFLTSSSIQFIRSGGDIAGTFKATNIISPNNITLEFPNKATGSYTIATTADIPTVSGFVPYTGATANVNLGTFHLDAGKGTFTHNGSTDTLTANHTSGSGIGLSITKGGANEGLKVNKTSGSGNAATIIGTLEATTLVKTGGTSSQYLMADGSTSLADIIFTIELVDALTVDFYAPYALKISSVSNVLNAPTITILDDGSSYTVGGGATIAIGSKITVTASIASVVNLNIIKA
jgi:hypothetical protein